MSSDHDKDKDSKIKGTKSADTLFGTAGNDRIDARDGNDVVWGMDGNDRIVGGRGEDTLLGGAGDDVLFGDEGGSGSGGAQALWNKGAGSGSGSGDDGFDDYLDGGAGNDFIFAGGGNDEVNHNVTENAGAMDHYAGGDGIDTLTLQMTRAAWFTPAVQADITAYLAFVAAHTDPATGEADSAGFQFTAFDLTVRAFEDLKVFVDGVELNPADEAVSAVNDAATVNEDDSATLMGSVLDNDAVPDLVYSVTLLTRPTHGILAFSAGTPGNPDGSYSFDPAGDFEDLAVGESRDVSFTYQVTDADGDTDQATVTITVTGSNDVPVAVADTGTTDENAAITIDVLANDTDVDLSDTHTVDAVSITSGGGAASIVANLVVWDPGTDYDYLAVGETATVVLAYDMSDNNGGTNTATVTITVTGSADGPVIDNIVTLTPFNDGFHGQLGNQQIEALSGDDWVTGDGIDHIATGTTVSGLGFGDDIINGAAGADTLFGDFWQMFTLGYTVSDITLNAGNDILNGGDGGDGIYGDAFYLSHADSVAGVVMTANGGNDLIHGDGGDDALYGDAAFMNVARTLAGSTSILNGGDDSVSGDLGNDLIYGDALTMKIIPGNSGTIEIHGGNDILDGGAGNDSIFGDAKIMRSRYTVDGNGLVTGGDDVLTGGAGDDILYGEGQEARIGNTSAAGPGNTNTILAGNDELHGGAGNDTLFGDFEFVFSNNAPGAILRGGDDLIDGGAGDDQLYGDFFQGAGIYGTRVTGGADVFLFATGSGNDVIHDFQDGTDLIDVSGYGYTAVGDMTITVVGADTLIDFGGGNSVLVAGNIAIGAGDFIFA